MSQRQKLWIYAAPLVTHVNALVISMNMIKSLGEIKEEYIGSWHAAPSVGSGYSERFVFFSSGNYLFFPSQYECDFGDEACVPSPYRGRYWGVQGQSNESCNKKEISEM